MSSPLRQPMQAAPSSQQSKRQILPPGSISTQDPTSTFGEFRNLTSTEVQYLRAGKKPYFQMTAEEKLNFRNTGTVPKVEGYVKPPPPSYGSYGQGLPPQQNPFNRFNRQIQTQPVGQQVPATQEKLNQALPPEIQKLRAQGLAFQQKVMSDPTLTNIRNQQNSLFSTIQQREQSYLSSVREYFKNAPPELQSFFNSPRLINTIMADYRNQQPEMRQINSLGQQYNQYVNTNYGKEQRNLQQQYQNQMQLFNQQQQQQLQAQPIQAQPLGNLFGVQGTPPPQQEAPPPEAYYNGKLRNRTRGGGYLPYGYMLGPADQIIRDPKVPDSEVEPSNIQNSIDPKVLEDILKNREERVYPRPVQPVQQDPIVDPLRPSTTVPKTITPIERPPVQPIVDPKRESFTPDQPDVIDDRAPDVKDPFRTPEIAAPTQIKQPPPNLIVDPKREAFTPDPPTSVDKGRVVDPLRPIKPASVQPIVDPKREPYTPPTPTSGLMPNSTKKRKAGMAPSQYSGVNTNVRGLMR